MIKSKGQQEGVEKIGERGGKKESNDELRKAGEGEKILKGIVNKGKKGKEGEVTELRKSRERI